MIGNIGWCSTFYVSLQEETDIIDRLWELEQSNVISFNDMEYDVAEKVLASFMILFTWYNIRLFKKCLTKLTRVLQWIMN